MPGDARGGRRRRQRVDVFAALDVSDLEAGALVAAAHDVAAVPAERDLLDAALHPRQRALAHPFGRVPQADERVRAPHGQVPPRGRELQAEAGRRVRVQRVQRCQRWVVEDLGGTVSRGEEEGVWGRLVRECGLVRL